MIYQARPTIQSVYNNTCNNDDVLGENFKHIKNGLGGTMRIKKTHCSLFKREKLRDLLCKMTLESYQDFKASQSLS